MPSRKRQREDPNAAANLLDALQKLRKAVDIEGLTEKMQQKAGHATQISAGTFTECIAEVLPAEGTTFEDNLSQLIYSRAQRATRSAGRDGPSGAALTEIIWLLKHHGVEKTVTSRTESRSGLQKDTAASRAFERYYQAQKIMPEGEWGEFMACIRTPLPMTLRMVPTRPYSGYVQSELRDLMERCASSGVELQSLPWCQHGWEGDRAGVIRAVSSPHTSYHSDAPHCKEMQDWCRQQNALGTGQFQETVSMIPPILLDPEPHHLVLDMCSAPGSKLLQAADIMNEKAEARGIPVSGGILSNEIDRKKAVQVLPARLKRVHAKSIVVLTSDARLFPPMYQCTKEEPAEGASPDDPRPASFSRILFDRIIADVPCSGDGTGRKDKSVWETWATSYSLSLHPKQLAILIRGIENLRPGGRIVYSTCSLNPLENEAVVHAALAAKPGQVALVDPPSEGAFASFKWTKGLTTWGVPTSDGELLYAPPEGLGPTEMRERHGWTASMFPPAAGAASPNPQDLQRCVRVHPHSNNTGGFFVAVIERVAEDPKVAEEQEAVTLSSKRIAESRTVVPPEGETDEEKLARRREMREHKRHVLGGIWGARYYYHLSSQQDDSWLEMAPHYGLKDDTLERKTLLVQLDEHDKSKKRKVFVATPGALKLLQALIPCTQTNNVRLAAVGSRFVTYIRGKYLEGKTKCFYRTAFEGSDDMAEVCTSKKVTLPVHRCMQFLENKSLSTTEMKKWPDAGRITGIDIHSEAYWMGPCLFGISPSDISSPEWIARYGKWDTIWFPAIIVGSKVELAVEDHERVGLLTLMKRIFPVAE